MGAWEGVWGRGFVLVWGMYAGWYVLERAIWAWAGNAAAESGRGPSARKKKGSFDQELTANMENALRSKLTQRAHTHPPTAAKGHTGAML